MEYTHSSTYLRTLFCEASLFSSPLAIVVMMAPETARSLPGPGTKGGCSWKLNLTVMKNEMGLPLPS